MRKYQGRPKKHPGFNKRSRIQRKRRAQEKNMKLNSRDVEDSEQADVFERSEIVDTTAFVSKENHCPDDFFPKSGNEKFDFSMPEVTANVPKTNQAFMRVKNETDSLITTIKAQEQQQDNPLITSILIKEENVEPDLTSLFPSTHQNSLITPNTERIVHGNSLITSIKTEEENSLISTIETHKRKEGNFRKKKKNKFIASFQTEEENMTDEQTKDLIVRFSRMYQNMLKVFFESKDDCHLMKSLRTFLQENEGLNNAESIVRFFESCKRKQHSDPPDLVLHSAKMHHNS
ncbi:uncharacterized protein LOC118202287 isoform X3 [Stegodyphus dumicola]|uniref:uncharacterized protein LOC118202287 isoform X3 n=1 Tax=Stegodyphus dumicola TaxID=202533 RepID=UPI0015B29291|nr:uncharacterized protein LOC118202287 isoform X3 [Stegodyphus dumicola]